MSVSTPYIEEIPEDFRFMLVCATHGLEEGVVPDMNSGDVVPRCVIHPPEGGYPE